MGTLTGRHGGLPQARAQGLAVGDKVDIGRDRHRPSPGVLEEGARQLQAKIQKASFPNPSDHIDFYFLANAGMCIPSVFKNKNKQSPSARNSCLVL
ncbi:unnamed protein product [Urochloa humidicola]